MNDKKNKFLIKDDNQGDRLDKFLAKIISSFPLSQKLIRKKLVKVNHRNAPASYKLMSGDEIEVLFDVSINNKDDQRKSKKTIDPQNIEKLKQAIIFKDDNVIAIDKPSGLAVQGGSGIKFSVDEALPHLKFDLQTNPRLVHRLDKDTSGILLIARNRQAADQLTEIFREKKIQKTYLAIVKGIPNKAAGVINMPLIKKYQGKNEKVYHDAQLGKEAITHYKLLKSDYNLNCSLLELNPITGRTHQLRVHLKEIGHPIIGDYKYGGKSALIANVVNPRQAAKFENRLHLHALKIEIRDDFFGKPLSLSTQQPAFSKLFRT
ncbi:MAG: RluA family pseudouridine synthase [Proteobacteria bacterium]|nr:RluA family pseudouridine synthase [Pseudomonadota bacterium]